MMKLAAISFAAEIRSGWKSLASILPEMSSASTMSIPSVELLVFFDVLCGRASATISSAVARHLRTNGRCCR